MAEDTANDLPQSPANQSADVREELGQENISKQGDPRSGAKAGEEMDSHFGAVEDDASGHSDQVLVTPPMTGPYNLIEGEGEEGGDQSEDVDPEDEIVGGA